MTRRYGWILALLLSTVTMVQGCAAVAGAAVGGGAVYLMHEEGYRFQSPVTK